MKWHARWGFGLALGLGSWSVATAQLDGIVSERPAEAMSFAWHDWDGDGWEDAFVVSPRLDGRLLRNRGDGTLEDVTALAGLDELRLVHFAMWEDVDGDGRSDLLVAGVGGVRLFRGESGGTFSDVTAGSGIELDGTPLAAAFVDFDRDERVDLLVRTTLASALFRNVGEGAFEAVELGLGASLAPLGETTGAEEVSPNEAGATSAEEAGASGAAPGERGPLEEGDVEVGASTRGAVLPLDPSVGGSDAGEVLTDGFPGARVAQALVNQASPGTVIRASTTPTLGMLYPISQSLYVDSNAGRVGVNTTTPVSRLDAVVLGGGPLSAVRGSGVLPPTIGHLGAQGTLDFEGVASADWLGYEIGVAGLSTGGSSTDNYGVLGHSNGVGVRGESAGNPTGVYAELGKATGVGIEASGTSLAGDFLGAVAVADDVTVTDGDFVVYSGATETVMLDGDDAGFGGGSQLFLRNASGTTTIEADADNAGTGNGGLAIRNSSGSNTVFLESALDGGGALTLRNQAVGSSILLDGEATSGFGGTIGMFNDAGARTFQLDSDFGGGAYMQVRNNVGQLRAMVDGHPAGVVGLYATDGSTTAYLTGEGPNSGGELILRNDVSGTTIDLIGDSGSGQSGRISMWDRTSGYNSIQVNGRDSAGTGAELLMLNQSGNVGFDLDAGGAVAAILYLRETDGSSAMEFVNDNLTLRNAAGTATITFNRSTGTKSAIVDTVHAGPRRVYAMESPEVWIEDFGSARLVDGTASVQLDPVFLGTVTVDEANQLRVYVTPNGECNGVWVEKGRAGFVVHELGAGASTVGFDWRVVGKRRGAEGIRLERWTEPDAADLVASPARAIVPAEVSDVAPAASERAPAIDPKGDLQASRPAPERARRELPPMSSFVDRLPAERASKAPTQAPRSE